MAESKQLKINKPSNYNLNDWELRVGRMNTCYDCEFMDLMSEHETKTGDEFVYERMMCDLCSCIIWPMTSINNDAKPCPMDRWEISNAKWRRLHDEDF